MVATLFYIDELPDIGAVAVVAGEEGFHAATVRRIRPGEHLVLGDGAGGLAACLVEHAGRDGLGARVLDRWTVASSCPPVTVVQALPKSERSELAVELATEAGADAFLAWQAARCVANWEGARLDKGLRRWRAVARSAARQSRRAHIPSVAGGLSTKALTPRGRARGRHRPRGDRCVDRRGCDRDSAGPDRAAHVDRGRSGVGRVGCAYGALGFAVEPLRSRVRNASTPLPVS